jgi:hypothetical protein
MTDTDKQSDAALEANLAQALGPEADDTAPLSRAVLSRMTETATSPRQPLSEVLADPLPVAGLLLGSLLLAGALGYALVPRDIGDAIVLYDLIGRGF